MTLRYEVRARDWQGAETWLCRTDSLAEARQELKTEARREWASVWIVDREER